MAIAKLTDLKQIVIRFKDVWNNPAGIDKLIHDTKKEYPLTEIAAIEDGIETGASGINQAVHTLCDRFKDASSNGDTSVFLAIAKEIEERQ